MQWDHYEYKIAEHFLPVLINADESGLDRNESRDIDAFRADACDTARTAGFTIGHWTDVDGTGEDWGRCAVTGLLAMRVTVRLMVYR